MNIYRLASNDTIEMMAQKRLATSNLEVVQNAVFAKTENMVCAWKRNSLYENCRHEQHMANSYRVSRDEVLPDGFYLERAQQVLKNEMEAQTTAHYTFLPYKRKYGVEASALDHDFTQLTKSVYEVAVGFTAELDGWPVIGPGGKAYVYMMPDGKVTQQKIYRKIPQDVVGTLTEKDIKTADEALAEVVKKENIELNDYKMVRQEFGYFYWGKNSIQNLIAPHYVFFFTPATGHYDTQTYYIVSAVKGDMAKLVDADYALEKSRKAQKLQNIQPAQEK